VHRHTLRDTNADDVKTGAYESDEWLRPGDELEHAGERWRVVDRRLAPEVEGYVAAVLVVERGWLTLLRER